MIHSVSNSAGVSNWSQQQPPPPAQPAKPKHHEKQDSVELSREAQLAAANKRQTEKL
jgi:hypothetical protein